MISVIYHSLRAFVYTDKDSKIVCSLAGQTYYLRSFLSILEEKLCSYMSILQKVQNNINIFPTIPLSSPNS